MKQKKYICKYLCCNLDSFLFLLLLNFFLVYLFRSQSSIDDLFENYISLPNDGKEAAEIIYDHRSYSGRKSNEEFTPFYNEFDSMLEEFGKAAEERRNSMVAHLPFCFFCPRYDKKGML